MEIMQERVLYEVRSGVDDACGRYTQFDVIVHIKRVVYVSPPQTLSGEPDVDDVVHETVYELLCRDTLKGDDDAQGNDWLYRRP